MLFNTRSRSFLSASALALRCLALPLTIAITTGCQGESPLPSQLPQPEENRQAKPSPSPSATSTPEPSPSPTPTPSASPSPEPSPTTPPQSGTLYEGPAEVEKYVEKFVDDGKIQGVELLTSMTQSKVQIQIADLGAYGSSTIGLCQTSGYARRVTFDTEFWNKSTETQRELLVHHELGHCILYRTHLNTRLADGRFASMMYPSIMPEATYLNYYSYYQQELFSTASFGWTFGRNVTHVCDGDKL